MSYDQAPWIVGAIVTLLGGNLGRYIWKAVHDWRAHQEARVTPREREQASIDASILTVARARDELEADNDRLRQAAREREAQHAVEVERLTAEIIRYREHVADLEARIVRERVESDERYAQLLAQVQALREHHPDDSERSSR